MDTTLQWSYILTSSIDHQLELNREGLVNVHVVLVGTVT